MFTILAEDNIQMKSISSSLTNTSLSTDRVSTASRQLLPKSDPMSDTAASNFQSQAFRREVPMPQNGAFVEVDGKKYFLDAPRGSSVNILV